MRVCTINDCDRKHKGAGYCSRHYQRYKIHGDPLGGGDFRSGEPFKFLLLSLEKATPVPCIIWPFGKDGEGYGRVTAKGRKWLAHRLALVIHLGKDETDKLAIHGPCHRRDCVNPFHLSFGTKKQNAADMRRDGTVLTKLTEDQVLSIRGDDRGGKEIAAEYGVSRRNVSMIKLRKTWRHL